MDPNDNENLDSPPDPALRTRQRRGIYLLPNLFTTATLFAGFYAVMMAMQGRFERAAVGIFVAMVMDGLDGRVARLTHTQSDFGAEYDSLSDMVAFGIAPALVIYVWALTELGKWGWLAAFVYTAAAALRLARFNTQVGVADKRFFQGLPSPSAAAILAGTVWLGVDHGVVGNDVKIAVWALTVVVGLLMVSNVSYRSFKEIDFKGKVPFIVAVVVMLSFAAIFSEPPLVLFTLFLAYAVSGPLVSLLRWYRKRIRARAAARDESRPEK